MKRMKIYSSLLFVLLFSAIARGQVIETGKWYLKQLGNSFSAQIKPGLSGTYVDLVLSYKGQAIVTRTYTATDSAIGIESRWNTGSITGTVRLQQGGRNQISTLDANLKLTDGSEHDEFTGQLAGWNSNGGSKNENQQSYDLGTICSVKTTIVGENRDITTIVFYSVNTPLYTVTLTSVTPSATTPNDIILGHLIIAKGAKINMQIPSRSQKGYIMLTCTITSGDNDPAQFSAQVASWDLSP